MVAEEQSQSIKAKLVLLDSIKFCESCHDNHGVSFEFQAIQYGRRERIGIVLYIWVVLSLRQTWEKRRVAH